MSSHNTGGGGAGNKATATATADVGQAQAHEGEGAPRQKRKRKKKTPPYRLEQKLKRFWKAQREEMQKLTVKYVVVERQTDGAFILETKVIALSFCCCCGWMHGWMDHSKFST